MNDNTAYDEAGLASLFQECSNWGRWGPDDELGTLNFITAATRKAAAALVIEGRTVALGAPMSSVVSSTNREPAQLQMLFSSSDPIFAIDHTDVSPHGFAITHLDALGHVFYDGWSYNGRLRDDVLGPHGLLACSVHALREGFFTRGVLLDVAAASVAGFLEEGAYVHAADLDRAEERCGIRVERGDAIFVHTGLSRRVEAQGPEDPALRAGLHADALRWIFEREVAVYSGDCVERRPYPSATMPHPLHQIGLVAMGLCMLDAPHLVELVAVARALDRSCFLVSCAPVDFPGATGAAVNPICVF